MIEKSNIQVIQRIYRTLYLVLGSMSFLVAIGLALLNQLATQGAAMSQQVYQSTEFWPLIAITLTQMVLYFLAAHFSDLEKSNFAMMLVVGIFLLLLQLGLIITGQVQIEITAGIYVIVHTGFCFLGLIQLSYFHKKDKKTVN